jgi:phosphatidate cytidylyltransferase
MHAMLPDPPPAPGPSLAPAPAIKKDLAPRVLSGVVMGAVALGCLYAGRLPFTGLILVVALLMSWEWGNVVRAGAVDNILVVHGLAVGAAVLLTAFGYAALAVIVLIVGMFIIAALRFGETARQSALGVLYVGVPAIALITLRSSEPHGLNAVLFTLLAVIVTDTCAYFAGRAIGGPKLWPKVSPNKTWSGLAGGVLGAAVVGAAFGAVVAGASSLRLVLIGLVLGLAAQAGDLGESALKRRFEIKDTSTLLPGHGGVMDRMDGIVTAATLALLIGLAVNMRHPARALLVGS